MESSGRAVFKTVPGFAFRAIFEGDIEGFTPVKVLVATTVFDLLFNLTQQELLQQINWNYEMNHYHLKVVYLVLHSFFQKINWNYEIKKL